VELKTRWLVLLVLVLPSCQYLQHLQRKPPEPIVQVRVDTVVITKQVAPPLPDGTPTEVCLSTGQTIQIVVSPKGDTLVGPSRMRLRDAPGVVIAGTYAGDASWFRGNEPIQFEKRAYTKSGAPLSPKCDDLKIVGDYNAFTILADVSAPTPLQKIYIPIRPGLFQPYTTTVPKPRKR
jgi:hypothetical protein